MQRHQLIDEKLKDISPWYILVYNEGQIILMLVTENLFTPCIKIIFVDIVKLFLEKHNISKVLSQLWKQSAFNTVEVKI